MKLAFKVTNNFNAIGAATRAGLAAAVAATALLVEADAKVQIQTGQKTGRIYKRGKKTHQASAPGQAPATDLGALAGSIHTRNAGPLSREIVAPMDYAQLLEFGTVHMAARPFMGPALKRVKPKFGQLCKKALNAKP